MNISKFVIFWKPTNLLLGFNVWLISNLILLMYISHVNVWSTLNALILNVPDVSGTHSHLCIHMLTSQVYGASRFPDTHWTRVKLGLLAVDITTVADGRETCSKPQTRNIIMYRKTESSRGKHVPLLWIQACYNHLINRMGICTKAVTCQHNLFSFCQNVLFNISETIHFIRRMHESLAVEISNFVIWFTNNV